MAKINESIIFAAMKQIKYFICMIMILTGVLAMNAVPFVHHHHHDGKICVETVADDAVDSHETETGENFHSEDGEYDMPRNDVRSYDEIITTITLIDYTNLSEDRSFTVLDEPDVAEIFSQEEYSANSQELRGSPIFS